MNNPPRLRVLKKGAKLKSPLPGEIIHFVNCFYKVFMRAAPFRGGYHAFGENHVCVIP
jgi:hypothetical protein